MVGRSSVFPIFFGAVMLALMANTVGVSIMCSFSIHLIDYFASLLVELIVPLHISVSPFS